MSEVKPLILIQYSFPITRNQYEAIMTKMESFTERSGWQVLVVDSMSQSNTQAFGITDDDLPQFEELKKLVYDNIKAR